MRRIQKFTSGPVALLCWLTSFILAASAATQAQTIKQAEERIPGVPAGYTIIEGDIQIPLSVANAMRQQRLSPAAPQAAFKTNLWPNGIIPFEFEDVCAPTSTCATAQPSGCVGLGRIGAMLDAMKALEDAAPVDFRQCPNNECSGNHMRFRDSTNDTVVAPGPGNVCQGTSANSSPVGMQGGQQGINIVSWTGASSKFIIVHELMHTLGIIHEQSRSDRDTFVDVTTFCGNVTGGCMSATYLNNFPKQNDANIYGPYDFDSVMHYGQCSFSSNMNCPAGGITISVNAPFTAQWQTAIGQRDHLSYLDGVTLTQLYALPNWRFVDFRNNAPTQRGTFLSPYQLFLTGQNTTPRGGTLWIQPGLYRDTRMLSKPMTLRAPLGGVTINPVVFAAGGPVVASVSAASYNGEMAADSIAAAFGENLAAGIAIAATLPLPTTLGGVTIKVTDAEDVTRDAPLFFVSPGQINYQIPTGVSVGIASIVVYNSGGAIVARGTAPITPAAPALFSANANGEGVPAAALLRLRGDEQFYEPVARYDAQLQRNVPVQIDLGPEGDQVFLILFGTGFRASGTSGAMMTIGDEEAEVLYAGPAPGFAGLDQANVRIPRSLVGKGDVSILLTADNRSANAVTVNVR